MNLIQLFDRSLRGRPELIGLEWNGQEYTFGQLERRSNRVANLLISRGLRKGDRLAVYLSNRIEFIDLYLACLKVGVIFLPVNILYRESEIAHIVSDADPASVVAGEPIADVVPFWTLSDIDARKLDTSDERPAVDLSADDPAMIVYTSGTTGPAKGVVLSHGNLESNAAHLITAWGISSEDRLLLALPVFHVHGLGNGIHTWLSEGFRLRLLERFEKETIADQFLSFHPTLFFGVPTMYVRLLDVDEDSARRIGAETRLFVSGSAPLAPDVFAAFREKYGHAILERYGMTETLMCLSNPLEGERRPGTVGLPLPGVEARIVDESGGQASSGIGELEVRGPNVFTRYWRQEDAASKSFDRGWFRTGDLAERSPDGYYTLHGRLREVIVTGGFKIFPREVEELVAGIDGVTEVAVVGAPDRVKGEIPVAFIVARDDLESGEIETWCRYRLAAFKVPRMWIRLSSLPRNALGKVQKQQLLARLVP